MSNEILCGCGRWRKKGTICICKKSTNFNIITSNIESLAEFLSILDGDQVCESCCAYYRKCNWEKPTCKQGIIEWLQQEVIK